MIADKLLYDGCLAGLFIMSNANANSILSCENIDKEKLSNGITHNYLNFAFLIAVWFLLRISTRNFVRNCFLPTRTKSLPRLKSESFRNDKSNNYANMHCTGTHLKGLRWKSISGTPPSLLLPRWSLRKAKGFGRLLQLELLAFAFENLDELSKTYGSKISGV